MVGGRLVVVMQVRRCGGYTVLRYLGPSGRKCLTMLFRKFARVYRLRMLTLHGNRALVGKR